MNIDELLAGPELDRLIASRVLHWTMTGPKQRFPEFSSDMTAAWQVIDTLAPRTKWYELVYRPDGHVCNLVGDPRYTAFAATPALAICQAGLKALEWLGELS